MYVHMFRMYISSVWFFPLCFVILLECLIIRVCVCGSTFSLKAEFCVHKHFLVSHEIGAIPSL